MLRDKGSREAMKSQEISNDCKLSRLKMAPQSKIPKPKVSSAASVLTSYPVHLHSTELSSEPCTPAGAINSSNLDSLIDSALKASMAKEEEHSWLIGADRGSNVDELLDQLDHVEYEDCIEGSIPAYDNYLPSDLEESQGSHYGPIDTTNNREEEVGLSEGKLEDSHARGYLQAFVGRLCSVAKTLDWLKSQPFSFTPETPLERSNMDSDDSNTRSTGSSSCKSSRSLSAAFDLAAIEPQTFRCSGVAAEHDTKSGASSSCVSRSIATQFRDYNRVEGKPNFNDEEEDDDFLSACSDSDYFEDSTAPPPAAASSEQFSTNSSTSSGADSDELHRSLIKTSMGAGGVTEWLSNGWQADEY